jgi:Protein of unknown function (DUF2370)
MIIDDMPTGSLWVFTANCIISFFFQFVGFLLTYLLHTSHAGKYGSRAGLGITLIQFGFYSRSVTFTPDPSPDGAQLEVNKPQDGSTPTTAEDELLPTVSSRDWLAFLFMTLGSFLAEMPLLPPNCGFYIPFRVVPPSFFHHRILACQALGKIHPFSVNTYNTGRYRAGHCHAPQP